MKKIVCIRHIHESVKDSEYFHVLVGYLLDDNWTRFKEIAADSVYPATVRKVSDHIFTNHKSITE